MKKKVVSNKDKKNKTPTSKILKLLGAIKLPNNFDYKNELGKAILKKHL